MQKLKAVIFIFLVFCFADTLWPQNNSYVEDGFSPSAIWEAGLPFTKNYTSDDFRYKPEIWSFIQGNDGLMYAGSNGGILEFDGSSWNHIPIRNQSLVRSMAKAEDGRIFVGGVRELGYLAPNSTGILEYQSLVTELKKEYHDFTDIWQTLVFNNSVFFVSSKYLFRWDGSAFMVWKPRHAFGHMAVVNNYLHIDSGGVGILKLADNKLEVIADFDIYEGTKGKTMFFVTLANQTVLMGRPNDGLFIFDGLKMSAHNSLSGDVLAKANMYKGIRLFNGDYAIGTLSSGVYIIDGLNGNIKKRLGKEHGLVSDAVYNVYESRDNSLWVGTDNGISVIDMASPLRRFNEINGINGRIRALSYHDSTLFLGSKELLRLNRSSSYSKDKSISFSSVQGMNSSSIKSLIPIKDKLMVFDHERIFQMNRDKSVDLIYDHEVITSSISSQRNDSIMYVGRRDGSVLEYNLVGDEWRSDQFLKVNGEIVQMVEEPNGNLWLCTFFNGVYYFEGRNEERLGGNSTDKPVHFDTISGLPSMSNNRIYKIDDNIYLTGQRGILKYDHISKTFGKASMLMNQFSETPNAYGFMTRDKFKNIWQTVKEGGRNKIIKYVENEEAKFPESNLFANFETSGIYCLEDIVFFYGPKGVIVYNQNIDRPTFKNLSAKLRKVKLENDSLVHSGSGRPANHKNKLEIPFIGNETKFEYSLPYYIKSEGNQYQYFLEGLNHDWSTWSTDTKKDFTNLPGGSYIFKVRAKNIFGQISKEDHFSFSILPPWYRTWWAYLAYVLMGVLLLWAFSQWRSGQLRKKNLALEAVVAERTDEIRKKNKTLSYQTERLKELDTMKTRLFANISHEFRTPLTLIKGPVEKLEREQNTQISMPNIKMIRRNANRLLNLVNQLLDLSKLDSGKLSLNKAEGDLFKSIRAAASAFSSHAASRNMDYQITVPATLLWASFDRDKLEKILYNLLSNAFKFTEDEGRVLLQAEFRNNKLRLKVADTGAGIPSEKLPHIFDRFYQVDDSYTREKAGSGIGLALTKELVELMGGTLFVESEPGHGTEFRVVMPLEKIETTQASDSANETPLLPEEVVENTTDKSDGQKTDGPVILIIEDNNDMRFFIREQLSSDYIVEEAINGEQGFEIAEANIPDLIITDLMMPRVDGITLCKRLKMQRSTSHIPVIMLTAKAGIENKLEGLETGADDYLTKPFNARELQIRVGNLIEQRARLRALYSKNVSLDPKTIAVNSVDEEFLEEVLAMMEMNYQDASFGPVQLQKTLAMSKTQLHRKLKALTDAPPSELLRNFRLKRAAQLLPQREDNISQVAYDVGFNSLSYFTKCFKDLYGVSPTRYIKDQGTSS